MIEGISLIDVTHDEAGQAFKRAMEIDSVSDHQFSVLNNEQFFFWGNRLVQILKLHVLILCRSSCDLLTIQVFFFFQQSIELVVAVNPEKQA